MKLKSLLLEKSDREETSIIITLNSRELAERFLKFLSVMERSANNGHSYGIGFIKDDIKDELWVDGDGSEKITKVEMKND